jgi:hypothetical protein
VESRKNVWFVFGFLKREFNAAEKSLNDREQVSLFETALN